MSAHRAHQDFSPWVHAGRAMQQWMENPVALDCPVPRTTLVWEHLDSEFWEKDITDIPRYPDSFYSWEPRIEAQLHLRCPPSWTAIIVSLRESFTGEDDHGGYQLQCKVSYGIIAIEVMNREPHLFSRLQRLDQRTPYISEIVKATYEKCFPINSIRHIFVEQILNRDTTRCLWRVYDSLYDGRDRRLMKTLTYGSPGFLAVLGSRVGKVVASFVLATFGRGVREIDSIFMFSYDDEYWCLRFDIGYVQR